MPQLLADAILDAVGTNADYGGRFTLLAESVLKSQIFSISNDVLGAAAAVIRGRPSSIEKTLPLCMPPFKSCFLEWTPQDDPQRLPATGDAPKPLRFGFLVESLSDDNPQKVGITFVWLHKTANVAKPEFALHVNPIGLIADWSRSDWRELSTLRSRVNYILDDRKFGHLPEEERAAAMRIIRTFVPVICPSCRGFIALLEQHQGEDAVSRFMKQSMGDLVGEEVNAAALLALINSRNCVDVAEDTRRSKLARKRAARGRSPIVSYANVKIRLSRHDQQAIREGRISEAEVRRHVVRGHFKVRRSGIYWWRAHFRGALSSGEVRRSGYDVEAA